jgi:hypothetical protein
VDVTLVQDPDVPDLVHLTVEDDDPEGFTNITHAYTLFAASEKKSQADKRGRFNLGEKLVIAACDHAEISTTTGRIVFDDDGGTSTPPTGPPARSSPGRSDDRRGVRRRRPRRLDAAPAPDKITTFNGEVLADPHARPHVRGEGLDGDRRRGRQDEADDPQDDTSSSTTRCPARRRPSTRWASPSWRPTAGGTSTSARRCRSASSATTSPRRGSATCAGSS